MSYLPLGAPPTATFTPFLPPRPPRPWYRVFARFLLRLLLSVLLCPPPFYRFHRMHVATTCRRFSCWSLFFSLARLQLIKSNTSARRLFHHERALLGTAKCLLDDLNVLDKRLTKRTTASADNSAKRVLVKSKKKKVKKTAYAHAPTQTVIFFFLRASTGISPCACCARACFASAELRFLGLLVFFKVFPFFHFFLSFDARPLFHADV